ncbi:hypothetical protein K461DRAFT_273462 [Myriangium duriaei CBS 260.36]|uniref:Uncharacterized protein n=1 Tax=Myriangium duriaei CBS 260.36 TaxID=1168546 RepID=A0A9P4JE28_9PEZI|nr:hypothetical protein K461DRAFT_273462 [Myriangium duriaei CBS 260.36]
MARSLTKKLAKITADSPLSNLAKIVANIPTKSLARDPAGGPTKRPTKSSTRERLSWTLRTIAKTKSSNNSISCSKNARSSLKNP